MAFEQATIKVEKEQEFCALKDALEQAFSAVNVESFLKQLDRKGIRVREVDSVLVQKVLEGFAGSGWNAKQLYDALSLSDQAQFRELYLSKLETVEQSLRHKFKKLYQYY